MAGRQATAIAYRTLLIEGLRKKGKYVRLPERKTIRYLEDMAKAHKLDYEQLRRDVGYK